MISLVLLLLAVPQDPKPDATKHPWAKWKVGTNITLKITTTIDGVDEVDERIQTLTQVTETKVTTSIQKKNPRSAVDKIGSTNEQELLDYPPCDPGLKKEGAETLTVDGKNYECTIFRSKRFEQETKLWVVEGVAFPLKWVHSKGSTLMTMTADKIDDPIAIGDASVKCVRYKGKTTEGKTSSSSVTWMSPEVPAYFVRIEGDVVAEGKKARVVMEITAFEIKK